MFPLRADPGFYFKSHLTHVLQRFKYFIPNYFNGKISRYLINHKANYFFPNFSLNMIAGFYFIKEYIYFFLHLSPSKTRYNLFVMFTVCLSASVHWYIPSICNSSWNTANTK